jgi:hypothetical protein
MPSFLGASRPIGAATLATSLTLALRGLRVLLGHECLPAEADVLLALRVHLALGAWLRVPPVEAYDAGNGEALAVADLFLGEIGERVEHVLDLLRPSYLVVVREDVGDLVLAQHGVLPPSRG